MKQYFVLIIFAAVFSAIGCSSIVAPGVTLTGEKTATENQIIGEYREIEPDAWAVSTVKTAVTRQKGSTVSSDPALMSALKMREMNEDQIRRYKNEEAAGESSNGFLAYRSVKKYESDRDLKKVILSVIDDENKARKTIFERSVVLSGKALPSDADIAAIGRQFAKDEQSRAQKNDWIQGTDGQWQRKK